jgi:sugar/nucleoside kinase (ribokinase family)
MNKYKVYGIGNALLDYEYKVNDTILSELSLDKGCMLLNDLEKHFKVHEFLKNIRPPEKIIPGGSVANSIYAMAQFNDKVCFSGKVSSDTTGDNFINSLVASGVDSYVAKIKKEKSGECLVLITSDNERTMNTYLGSSALLDEKDINITAIENTEYLLIEGYLVTSENTLAASIYALNYASKMDTKTVITLSDPNIVSFFRDSLMQLFNNKANIIFCNEQEALNFSQTKNINDAEVFLRKISKKYIITLGSQGAICFDGCNSYKTDGLDVSAKDFTGAGDMFLGAFMHMYDGSNPQEALNFANFCASKIIQIYGAKFNSSKSYKELKDGFK